MDIEDKVLIGAGVLLAMCLAAMIILVSLPRPSDYERARAVFVECIADDTFTRDECVLLAGVETGDR